MRTHLILAAAAFTVLSAPAFAQSEPAHPVMPAQREPTNPNANIAPPPVAVPEGRAAAPQGETVPNGNVREKARSGANGS